MKLDRTTYKRHHWWMAALLCLTACLMAGCDGGQNEPDDGGNVRLQVQSLTRSGEGDEEPAVELKDGTTIRMLLATATTGGEGVSKSSGQVTYVKTQTRNEWNSEVYVKAGTNYFVYGFMPSGIATQSQISDPNADGGAKLTLSGLSVLSAEDVCVIVGVAKGNEPVVPTKGEFGYAADDENSISLLMDHLFAAVDLKFKVSTEYSRLRKIKIKEVWLKLTKPIADGKGSCEITFAHSATYPIFSIGSTTTQGTGTKPETMLYPLNSEGTVELKTDETFDCSGYFSPTFAQAVSVVTTYEVWDNHEKKLHDRTAENPLGELLASVKRGERKEITLTVNPTYLYVLSEPDLDNPTLEVN